MTNGVGEIRYNTIHNQNFVSSGKLVWKLLGDEVKFYTYPDRQTDTDTHTHTRTHRHTHTHTHTHTPAAHFMYFF